MELPKSDQYHIYIIIICYHCYHYHLLLFIINLFNYILSWNIAFSLLYLCLEWPLLLSMLLTGNTLNIRNLSINGNKLLISLKIKSLSNLIH
jgi:hypothetical protein